MSTVEGTVIESLPHDLFEIEQDNGQRIVGHVAGKDRPLILRILPGDRVTVELSPYDLTRGRIVKRRH